MSYSQQQIITLSGKVTDGEQEALIGTSIQIKGTTSGTITDFNGNFRLETTRSSGILVISYLGYTTQEIPYNSTQTFNIILTEETTILSDIQVIAYGVQEKQTLTGAITSVGNEVLVRSPNASVANTLAGQLTGVSTVQSSGQPGKEDPKIFVRGAGSLTDNSSSPLILVDGVERAFFQMDPNEIESVTVLKDASATAVFGVRGANGVILVTTRRGEKGKAKISYSSSVGVQSPVHLIETLNSYDMASMFNEMDRNDGTPERFDTYTLERFRLGDEPLMYPDMDWRDYLLKDYTIQTQHNVNITGGTDRVRYFTSVGYLYQNGIMKDLGGDLPYDPNFSYNRFNYRTNLDIDITKSTSLKINIGGIVGDTYSPIQHGDGMWRQLAWAHPFDSPGVIDGHFMGINQAYVGNMATKNPLDGYWGKGYLQEMNNRMNLDIALTQKLGFITKGLKFDLKAAYNTNYTFNKRRTYSVERWVPFYLSHANGRPLSQVEEPDFDKTVVYRINGTDGELGYNEPNSAKGRNWYLEGAFNYNRKYGDHTVSGLLLYNQSKTYYPSTYPMNPTGYVGLVTRVSYNYQQKYMAEFNAGYNGSENFAPGLRYGFFPAGSLGWVVSEENFMKSQKLVNYLKLRASIGLVGNDQIGGKRYMYLPDSYNVNQAGYNFGYDIAQNLQSASENLLSNPYVTWEKALKKNLGIDMAFLNNKLRITADFFHDNRTDILITRQVIPGIMAFTSNTLPPVNMGEVENKGYELEVKWNDKISDFRYWIEPNISFVRNKIIYMDEIPPTEPYQAETGRSTNAILGYLTEGFYGEDDFADLSNNVLKDGLPVPVKLVYPGDVKYVDVNKDGLITEADMKFIGFPTRPEYVLGLNYGISYKGFDLSMNWAGALNRSVALNGYYRIPGAPTGVRAIFSYMMEERWTPETAETATAPRFSRTSVTHNYYDSDLWVRDGSYLRLKNAKVGYTFNQSTFLKQIGISQLSLYVTGYNLLTFDKLKIIDPEFNDSANLGYPIIKIYNVGLNVTF
ncbi:MAG: TonB-dependent receptor [Pigmentiphaga sp.]|nr:TonB-dependent receptor [Pigmentiphaga sp.]